uniref:BED-type domain-containing protein n=1 Tax=Meloidogyne hapla TaxID=6305 RepID=A0A1I8BA92_MELHA
MAPFQPSNIWEHFIKIPNSPIAECKLCQKFFSRVWGTSGLWRHLKCKHKNEYNFLQNMESTNIVKSWKNGSTDNLNIQNNISKEQSLQNQSTPLTTGKKSKPQIFELEDNEDIQQNSQTTQNCNCDRPKHIFPNFVCNLIKDNSTEDALTMIKLNWKQFHDDYPKIYLQLLLYNFLEICLEIIKIEEENDKKEKKTKLVDLGEKIYEQKTLLIENEELNEENIDIIEKILQLFWKKNQIDEINEYFEKLVDRIEVAELTKEKLVEY